jgi:predicted metalloprotease with PDZ domain
MLYKFSYKNPHAQYIDIEFSAEGISSDELEIQLPAWRPGRYELFDFAKNIQKWQAYDGQGNKLKSRKIKKDRWLVETKGIKKLLIKYNYYSAELNAGSTWVDDNKLYVNPVNCCIYIPDRMDEQCSVELEIPDEYIIATGMEVSGKTMKASGFHELADSPFIASASLAQKMFIYEGVEFHLWFQGLEKPDWEKLLSDFFVFIDQQYQLFGEFPVKKYHFIFQILPYQAYHGVEHCNSTVIVLGPLYDIFEMNLYNELLGVSSHELFHTWNIKQIRPLEMMPYDYSKENYTRLGFVAEGVTTYYGDLMLFRSGIFSDGEYFKTFNQQLKKHFDHFGRFNMSVADSSFDTWLDGYVQGVPNRKVSIYAEGCLLAFITDILIRKNSMGKSSLDQVMKSLYYNYAKKGKGYSEQDYRAEVEKAAGTDLSGLFDLIYRAGDFEPYLNDCLQYIGLKIHKMPSLRFCEARMGIKVTEEEGRAEVVSVYPGSVAEEAGLIIGDYITGVKGIKINNNFNHWCRYYAKQKDSSIELNVMRNSVSLDLHVPVRRDVYFQNYFLTKLTDASREQKEAYAAWANRPLMKK